MRLQQGNFCEFGGRVHKDWITFTYQTKTKKESYINIYDIKTYKLISKIEVTSEYKMGLVCSISVHGLNPNDIYVVDAQKGVIDQNGRSKTVLKGLLLSKERECYKGIDKQQETEKSQYGQEQYDSTIQPTNNETNLPARQNRFSRFFNQIRSRFARQNYNTNTNSQRRNPFSRRKQEESQYDNKNTPEQQTFQPKQKSQEKKSWELEPEEKARIQRETAEIAKKFREQEEQQKQVPTQEIQQGNFEEAEQYCSKEFNKTSSLSSYKKTVDTIAKESNYSENEKEAFEQYVLHVIQQQYSGYSFDQVQQNDKECIVTLKVEGVSSEDLSTIDIQTMEEDLKKEIFNTQSEEYIVAYFNALSQQVDRLPKSDTLTYFVLEKEGDQWKITSMVNES